MSLSFRSAFASAALSLIALVGLAGFQPLSAQDTRTVNEPTFPATCSALAAQQAIVSGEPASETLFDTTRLQTALNACASGKAVELTTSGTNNAFLIAPITIPNGVTLLVDAGVTVFGSRNPADYQVTTAGVETCGTVGTAGNGCNPLFNVNSGNTSSGSGVMGYGIINGRGGDKLLVNGVASASSWWDIANAANTGSNSQNNPIMFAIKKASNFTMYKITLMNSPMFHVKWQNATGLTIWGVKIVTPYSARNTDGIDPGDSVSNITIANSYISDGDDNVAIGATAGNPASNVSITNVHTYSGHGLSIGSYTAGGVSNIAMTGINQSGNLQDSNATGLRIKSGPDRGGVVNNVQYSKVCIQNVKYPVQFNPTYSATTGALPPTFTNIGFHNVSVQTTNTTDSVSLQGYSVNNPLNITMDNLQFMHNFAAGGDSQGNLLLTPTPKNVNITLGPGPVDPTSLQQITGNNVTYTGLITNPTQSRYLCPTTNFPFIAGELFLSTSTVTNQRTLSLGNPATFTLNAVVEITEAGGPTPTAAVKFYEGTTVVGTGTLGGNGTVATVTLSGITSGAHTYTAQYSGDTNYAAVAFGSVTVNVNTIATTTTLTATPTSAIYGNGVTLTTTVAQSTGTVVPGGTVTVTASDGTVVGTGSLNAAGIYSFTTTTLPVGVNSLTASYAGSSNFAASDSTVSPTTVTITAANTTTTLTALPSPTTYGNTVTLTAKVVSVTTNTPTGTVTFTDSPSGNIVGTTTLTGNTAVLTTTTLTAGTHSITATYGGDSNFNTSTSAASPVLIATASTTTSVGFTATTSPYGAAVTIIASLTPSGGTQTGTVTFYDGSTANPPIGTGTVTSAAATMTISTLSIGVHNIIAVYGGDGNYTGSSSAATPLTITQAASSTTIAATSTNPTYGTSDTFTATITVTTSGAPTGTVTFKEGSTTLGTGAVSTTGGVSTATFSTSSLAVGAHSIFAVYGGDVNFTGSSSPTITVTVAAAATTTTLVPPASIVYGNSASLSASVATAVTGTPTGTVTFFEGATQIGSPVALSGGTASASIPNLSAGTHSITAKYSGDANFAASTSAPQNLLVSKAPTTTAGSANPATVAYGTSTTISGAVTPSSATGTITFNDGGTAIRTVTVSSGTASFSTSTLSTGTHTLTAVYSGDSNYTTSISTTFTVTVTQASSTTTLVASPTNPVFLTSVTLTATVPNGATGTVSFKDGSIVIGSGSVSGASTATFSTSSLTGGAHSITACYGGDVNFVASCSTATTVTVSTAATSTALTTSANPAAFNSSVTLTATISPAAATVETGTVTFKDGATVLGSGTVSNIGGIGVATFTTSALTGGSHTLTAVYGGDSNFAGSTSPSISQSITPAATVTALAATPTTTTYGTSVSFTATITPSLSTAETGTVTFKDGSTVIGTGTVSTTGGISTATFATTTLGGGTHSITAAYSGDTNFAASSSTAVGVTINPAITTTALAANPATTTYGTSVSLTANVVSASATGTVTFKDGSTTLGTVTLSGGTATFSTPSLSTTTHTLVACYSGDTNFAGSCSSTTNVIVNPATPAVGLNANPSSLTFGQSTTLTATLTPTTASGTVVFFDQTISQQVGTANVVGGVATVTASSLAGGTHTLIATYSGDSNYTTAQSATIAVIVNRASASDVLTITPTSSTYGTSVTFTAKVTPSTATGTVTFSSGGTTFGSAAVVAGTATFTSSTIPAGSYSTIAAYSGDANYSASFSTGVLFSVGKATSSAVLTSSASTITYGNPVTFTVALAPVTTTGAVTFSDGSTIIGTGTASNGVASLTTSALTGGSHTISAVYAGDNNFSGSSTNIVTVIVSVATSTTSVSANPSTVPYNSASTLTATVVPAVATGTITFRDGAALIATVTITNGSASTSAKLAGGSHSITATYSGDTNVGGNTSAATTLTVSPLAVPIALTVAPTNSTYGAAVTFTAALTPPAGTVPTGTVTFMDGATTLVSMSISANQATATFSTLLPGSHSIVAVYSGDANFASVTTAPSSITVTMGNSTTTLTSTPPQATPGATFTLNTNVTATTPTAGENPPTGSVVFSDSNGTIATVPLVNGAASLTRSLTPLGPHTYTATYSGDADYTVSNASVTVVIKQISSSTTISATPTSGVYGGATYSFTGTVTPGGAGPTLTGSVSFHDASTIPATSLGAAVPLSGTTATLSGVSLSGGTHNIVAIYSGDTTYTSSDTITAPAVITVSKAASSTVLSSSVSTVTTGNPVTLTAVATSTASGTLSGTVSFFEGTTLIQTVPYVTGGVSTTISSLSVGTHSYTAVYSGDANYSTSTSTATSVTSNPIAQTITVTGAPALLTYGASPFVVSATSNSGLPVSLAVTGPATVIGNTFTVTGAGTITITATQAGDATHSAATPVVVTVLVNKAPLTVTVNNASIAPGQAIPPFTGTVTGVVNNDGITASYATVATSSSPAGQYQITATLNDPNNRLANYAVTNPGGTLTIVANTQTITFPAITTTATYGAAPIALSATASSGLAITYTVTGPGSIAASTLVIGGAGTITVTATQPGNGTFSAATPVSQTVTVAQAPLTIVVGNASRAFGATNPAFTGTITGLVGSDSITATYGTTATASSTPGTYPITATLVDPGSRASNYNVTNTPGTLTVTASTTTLSLSSNLTTVVFGSPVNFTAAAAGNAGGTPTGNVTFFDGTTSLGVKALSAGSANLSTSALAIGAHTITANYSGDANFAAATTTTSVIVTVSQAASTTALAANPTTATFGNPIALTATVSNTTTTTATGTVTFKDGTTTLGTASMTAGVAAFSVSNLAGGSHTLTACYSGDVNFIASCSSTATVTVNATSTTTAVTGSAATGVLEASATFTGTVTSSATGTPTGTLVFSDGSTTLGTVTMTSGAASLTISTLSIGTHSISACYSGDANFAASCSVASFTYKVTQAAAATSLTVTPTTTAYGGTLGFTAKVTSSLSTLPTGSITLKSGTVTLGTATLANVGGVATATLNASSTLTGIGSFTAVATYSGDANYLGSDTSAAPTTFSVTAASTSTAIAISAPQIIAGGSVTFTGTVTSGAGSPGGTVQFLNGGTLLATGTLNASGVATATISSLGVGSYSVTASYAASGNYAASVSAASALSVVAPVTMTANPNALSLGPGASGTSSISIAPVLGYTGPVTLICASPVTYITCVVTTPGAITGTSPATATATLSVAATYGSLHAPIFGPEVSGTKLAWLLPIGGLLLLPFARKRGMRMLAVLLLLCGTTAAVSGCGSSGSLPGKPPTGPQTVTLTTTANGATVTATITVTVTN